MHSNKKGVYQKSYLANVYAQVPKIMSQQDTYAKPMKVFSPESQNIVQMNLVITLNVQLKIVNILVLGGPTILITLFQNIVKIVF